MINSSYVTGVTIFFQKVMGMVPGNLLERETDSCDAWEEEEKVAAMRRLGTWKDGLVSKYVKV